MKAIRLEPNVPAEIRAIDRHATITILRAIHRYTETGTGRVKALSGAFEGFLRLRVGSHGVFFEETADAITVHHVSNRKDAYR